MTAYQVAGHLWKKEGVSYIADVDADHPLASQAASCTYRIALGPRAGQKVLSSSHQPHLSAPCRSRPWSPLEAPCGDKGQRQLSEII